MEEKKDNKKSSKKIFYIVLLLLFTVGIAVCATLLIRKKLSEKHAKDTYSDMQEMVTESVNSSEETEVPLATENLSTEEIDYLAKLGIVIPEKSIDWDALWEENRDIYAWIYIPGTAVDYPILQHPTEDDYYLDHNLDGSTGYPGCIYTQLRNHKDFQDYVTVLYGHNMKDGTMFQTLHQYGDSTFYNQNRYMFVYTPDTVYVYQIFSAVTFHDDNVLLEYDMEKDTERTRFINDLAACRSMTDQHSPDAYVIPSSHILTLSTCISGSPSNRWLVNGVLLNDGVSLDDFEGVSTGGVEPE